MKEKQKATQHKACIAQGCIAGEKAAERKMVMQKEWKNEEDTEKQTKTKKTQGNDQKLLNL